MHEFYDSVFIFCRNTECGSDDGHKLSFYGEIRKKYACTRII